MRIAIVSDTHGLLRPELFDEIDGVEHILFAGDLGEVDLLAELEAVAPVTGVWGNTDGHDVRARLPEVARVELEGASIVVVHGQQFGTPTPPALAEAHPRADLIVFGHTHRPLVERIGRTLVVNPGSAGPRRFRLPTTIALGEVKGGTASARLVHLLDGTR